MKSPKVYKRPGYGETMKEMHFTLQRMVTGEGVVLGVLYHNQTNEFFCTLEPDPPIQSGRYYLVRYLSPKNQATVWLFLDVPDHDYVEIHIGNTRQDTRLCVLIGEEFGRLVDDGPAVVRSRDAFRRFMRLTENQDQLRILVLDPIINPKGEKDHGKEKRGGS